MGKLSLWTAIFLGALGYHTEAHAWRFRRYYQPRVRTFFPQSQNFSPAYRGPGSPMIRIQPRNDVPTRQAVYSGGHESASPHVATPMRPVATSTSPRAEPSAHDELRHKIRLVDCAGPRSGFVSPSIADPASPSTAASEAARTAQVLPEADKLMDDLLLLQRQGELPSDLALQIGLSDQKVAEYGLNLPKGYKLARENKNGVLGNVVYLSVENRPSLSELRQFFTENQTGGTRMNSAAFYLERKRLSCEASLPVRAAVLDGVSYEQGTLAGFAKAADTIRRLGNRGFKVRPPLKQIQVTTNVTGARFFNEFEQVLLVSPQVTEEELLPFLVR